MNDASKNQLSALLDGELGRDEVRFLLRRVQSDPELVQTWTRYQMIGDSLRGNAMPVNLSVRVMQVIESEAVMAEASDHASARQPVRWLRYGLGGSLAAGVAVAALVWLQPRQAASPAQLASQQAAVSSSARAVAEVQAPVRQAASAETSSPNLNSLFNQAGSPYINVMPAAAVRSSRVPSPMLPSSRPGSAWAQAGEDLSYQSFVLQTPRTGPPRATKDQSIEAQHQPSVRVVAH